MTSGVGFPTQSEATTPMFARISWKALESECLSAYPGQHRTTRITSPEVHSFSLGCCPTLPRKERLAGQFFARNWGKNAAGTTATNLSAVTWVTAGEQLWKHSTSFNKSATDHNRSPTSRVRVLKHLQDALTGDSTSFTMIQLGGD